MPMYTGSPALAVEVVHRKAGVLRWSCSVASDVETGHNLRSGIALVLVATVMWSTAGLFTRVVSTDLPTTLFWRSLTGALCVLVFHLALTRSSPWQAFRFTRGEFFIGLLGMAGQCCFIAAFFHTSIAAVSFLYGLMPLMTFVLAMTLLKAKVDLVSVTACLLGAGGTAVIMWDSSGLDDLLGILLALGMSLFMAALTVATKYYPNASAGKATYLSAFLTSLVTLPLSSFGDTLLIDYLWLFLYGFTSIGLGFGLYLLGVKRVTALTAALIGQLEGPLGTLFAWLLLQEEAGVRTLMGGAIIMIAAVIYVVRKEKSEKLDKTLMPNP